MLFVHIRIKQQQNPLIKLAYFIKEKKVAIVYGLGLPAESLVYKINNKHNNTEYTHKNRSSR